MLDTPVFAYGKNSTYAQAVAVGLLPADTPTGYLVEHAPHGAVFHTNHKCCSTTIELSAGVAGDVLDRPDSWCDVCVPKVGTWNQFVTAEHWPWLNWLTAADTLEQRIDRDLFRLGDHTTAVALLGELRLLTATVDAPGLTPPAKLAAPVATARELLEDWREDLTAAAADVDATVPGDRDAADTPHGWWLLLLSRAFGDYRDTAADASSDHPAELLRLLEVLGRGDVAGTIEVQALTFGMTRGVGLLVRVPGSYVTTYEQSRKRTTLTETVHLTRHAHAAASDVTAALAVAPPAPSYETVSETLDDLVLAMTATTLSVPA